MRIPEKRHKVLLLLTHDQRIILTALSIGANKTMSDFVGDWLNTHSEEVGAELVAKYSKLEKVSK